ncbi:hydrolase [Acinetobacter sp. S40]|uniref:hydrolase n=1 Tax=unclassified Acinetobacter TaxID=196816 RepID=UPI001909807B|nr:MULTISPECIES: hydrolase [unclassified Acinetobacter]MBJ9985190.1 hydrolase [Acinetobacter sp. S40]MBK0063324.1 hydrolase [Acinetobacter sp. S55]MBK0066764.1 hydrolase [Acinetobacter sp. S54]
MQLPLITPDECVLVLVDHQAGLAFGVGSKDRQVLLNNAIALARTAKVFNIPIIASTSASKVYSGPMLPALHREIPEVQPIERRNMNAWEDDTVRQAILDTGRKHILLSGMLTEACVSFLALSAAASGLNVSVVADTCGGLTLESHELALQRMQSKNIQMVSWIQILLELQRDWTRKDTYDGARAIVEGFAGGYGIGLAYARDMIKPT